MKLSDELQWRGLVHQTTYEDISRIDGEPITFYRGVDPSAPSMTIGNLGAAMAIYHLARHGHKPVLLLGGATGMIGDPDGKSEERSLKSYEEVQTYKDGIAQQYERLFGDIDFMLVDNYDWFKDMGYLQFLRDVGKHVPMRQMLARDFIKDRLGEESTGISYAEFSYVLIQAYDFLHLSRTQGVTMQFCGSDQWGNSIAGVELIRRIDGGEAHVYSVPLVINRATGKNFGKTEDGAVWLDENLTSVYKFYQFWLNIDDEGAIDYMKVYTLLEREEIERIAGEFEQNRAGRLAQKTLAYEVTKLVHGQERSDSVRRISEVLFGGRDYAELQTADFEQLKTELPFAEGGERDLVAVLAGSDLASSKTEARRFLQSKAIYLNGVQVSEDKAQLSPADTVDGFIIIRRGKNQHILYKLV